MNNTVLFHIAGSKKMQRLFEEQVVSVIPRNRRIVCDSIRELSDAIRRSAVGQCLCVLLTGDRSDLLDLFSIQDLLRESRLILILPDNSETSAEMGHRLYPRFSDSVDSGFANTAAVLSKMAGVDASTEPVSVQPGTVTEMTATQDNA